MDTTAPIKRAKSMADIGLSGVFIDILYPRSKDAMLPGKTYTRKGAFVRKRASSTPKKKPVQQNLDDDVSGTEDPPPQDEPRGPSKAALTAAKVAATKKVDLPSPSGLYDSTSVQDRIRAWQSDGGGVVTASDTVVEFEDSDVEELRQRRSKPTSPIKDRWGAREEIKIPKRANARKVSPTRETPERDTQARGSTPRKRIISDGHWKLSDKNNNVNAHTFDDGIRVKPVEDGEDQSKKKIGGTKTYLDDGIRVYATPTNSRKNSDTKQDSQTQAPTSPQTSETGSTHSEDATTETADDKEYGKSTVKRKDTKRSARGIFGAVLEESKRMFARTETVYINQPENPRIDNWLGAIPDLPDDPFVNDEKMPEAVDFFKTESRLRRKSKTSPMASPDPNGIWDVLSASGTIPDSAEDLWRRQRRRRHSKASLNDKSSGKEDSGQHRETTSEDEDADLVPKPLNPAGLRRKSTNLSYDYPSERPKRNTLGVAALQSLFSATKEEKSPKRSPTIPTPRSTSPESDVAAARTKTRRPFPTVGVHRLSTIASMGTLQTDAAKSVTSDVSGDSQFTAKPKGAAINDSESYDKIPSSTPRRKRTRLTRHADLISVLSAPRTTGKSIRSARSVRTHRSRLETATIPDLMKELVADEVKYMRELRTMVDGVIPVLLTSVLSKSDSPTIANLFSPLGISSPVSDTIYAMGVALENLKKWHKRLEQLSPLETATATIFLTWAQGVQRTYKDYLKAWRMGFQDVVVNLASDTDGHNQQNGLDKGLPRNEDGDVINLNGERVDVAFLLKRPLVRLKYLAKTLKGVNFVQPSTLAEKLASDYQILIEEARHRVNEEKARLEDEAAAAIDASKARAVVNLKPVSDFAVNKSRRVRARDAFDLSLLHSDGQRLEGRIELFLREDPPGIGTKTDLLICQVDGSGKWLLFPPIASTDVSARMGDSPVEIVMMIRGSLPDGKEWHEMLSLTGDDEQVSYEWVQMLGLSPIPPHIPQKQPLGLNGIGKISAPSRRAAESVISDSIASTISYTTRRTGFAHQELQTPLGENIRPRFNSLASDHPRSRSDGPTKSRDRVLQARRSIRDLQATETPIAEVGEEAAERCRDRGRSSSSQQTRTPRSLNEAMSMAGSPNSTLKRQCATRKRPQSISLERPPASQSREPSSSDPNPNHHVTPLDFGQATAKLEHDVRPSVSSDLKQRSFTEPSTEMPTLSKLRKIPRKPTSAEVVQSIGETSSANKLTKPIPQAASEDLPPPPPPPHRVSMPIKSAKSATPEYNPSSIRSKRLSSSPLKYQYEPSSASDDGSDTSSVSKESDSVSSSSDDEDELETDDITGSLPQPFPVVQAPASQPSLPSKTLGPSSSASQAPYKTVPAQPNKALHVAATILYWSERDQWVALHDDPCSIVITPGLVEIYQTTLAHSHNMAYSMDAANLKLPGPASQPLLVLHLTPMVLLQQGTALDVTVRSPPQGGILKEQVKAVNFLFRSSNAQEAEGLYGMFHHSRMNNPTYIALQQARATADKPTFDTSLGRGKQRTSSSWFSFGRQKSYRAMSVPTPRVKSDPSVGTRKTSFSAKVFGNGRFNIAKSSIMSRRSPDGSIYTTSDNSLESGASTAISGGADASAQLGLSNTKIRLYSREGTKWLDLGPASLTIMRPNNLANPLSLGGDLNSPPDVGYAHGVGANGVMTPTQKRSADDKRIVVVSAKKEAPLLDVTLGDSCFERTARTGIAISLWELFEGGTVADRGGVTNGRYKYFMMQFQNEAACAFTFSIVGRHRY